MALEDFTTYTEVDSSNRVTVTSSKLDWANTLDSQSIRVYYDKGTSFYDGDYEFNFEVYINSSSGQNSQIGVFALNHTANLTVQNKYTEYATTVMTYAHSTSPAIALKYRLTEQQNASVSENTLYYCTIWRDMTVGTYGTVYLDVYSDSDRTTQVGSTLSVAYGRDEAYSHIYGVFNQGTSVGGQICYGYMQNLEQITSSTFTPKVMMY